MGINELPSPPLLVEPKPEGRASRVRGGGGGVSGRPGLEMPYTHTPTLAALLECGHCGKSQGIPEPPDRGSSHFGAWQTAPHQESFERTDKPNLTGVSRCLTDSLLLGYLAAATAVLLPGPLQRGYGVLSERTCVHGQLGRLPSAKHGCPPGLGPLPGSSPPTTKRHHHPNRSCSSSCSSDKPPAPNTLQDRVHGIITAEHFRIGHRR